jgi:flagellar protein FliJ
MARRFQFRLEVVERLRRQAVDQHRRVVAEKTRAVTSAESRLSDITAQLRETVSLSRKERLSASLDVNALRNHQVHSGWLQRKALDAQSELMLRRSELRDARARLAEASKQLKVIEKLRERQWARFNEKQQRREQNEADEVGLQQYFRRLRDERCDSQEGLLLGNMMGEATV